MNDQQKKITEALLASFRSSGATCHRCFSRDNSLPTFAESALGELVGAGVETFAELDAKKASAK